MPVVLLDNGSMEMAALGAALEREGLRPDVRSVIEPESPAQPFPHALIMEGRAEGSVPRWIETAERGGCVVLIDPLPQQASQLGFCANGTGGQGLYLGGLCSPDGADVHLLGTRAVPHSSAAGRVHAVLRSPVAEEPDRPVIVEVQVGQGKVLVFFFSVGRWVVSLQQRRGHEGDAAGKRSAERVLTDGVPAASTLRPQLDIVLGFLCRWLCMELAEAGEPLVLAARFPRGNGSLVAFSFDDLCPSGKPLKAAWRHLRCEMRAGAGRTRLVEAGRLLAHEARAYPRNYRGDVASLLKLFGRFNASATAFVLPFLGPVRNRPRLTGYRGFSPEMFVALQGAGWDVGTHMKPSRTADYGVLCRAFSKRFGTSPGGHRGHELGWARGEEDWRVLSRLGYRYDSTWTCGGHAEPRWVTGTGNPFRPFDENGSRVPILEVPVVAWLDDMVADPPRALGALVRCLDTFPGFYHLAGHSWLMRREGYPQLIEEILRLCKRREDLGGVLDLSTLTRFWNAREQSGVRDVSWSAAAGRLSFTTISECEDGELAWDVPARLGELALSAVTVEGAPLAVRGVNRWRLAFGSFVVTKGSSRVVAVYGGRPASSQAGEGVQR